MKYSLFAIFLLVGASHGFFGSIGQSINNVGNSVNSGANQLGGSIHSITSLMSESVEKFVNDLRGHVENFIRELLNTVKELPAAANSLWENVFSPVFDMLTTGGRSFLNDKFGAIAAIIGRPIAVPENPLSEKYAELIARLKSNVHHLYEQLFLMEKEALAALENGEYNFEERIRAFHDKIAAIHQQINEWATEAKTELQAHAGAMQGELTNVVNQYSQNIDLSAKTISAMFQQLGHSLMNNLLEVVLGIVPNAMEAIQRMKEQGLLSFFQQ